MLTSTLRYDSRKGNDNLVRRFLLKSSATITTLTLSLAVQLFMAPGALAKSNHHCGSLIITNLGETGDTKCLGQKTLTVGYGNPFGNLPTCGDTRIRTITAGLRGGVYRIRMVDRISMTYSGVPAYRYQWNFADYTKSWVGYRYCRR